MGIKALCAAAAVVIGAAQAEAATASFYTEHYMYLRLASAKMVGTGEDVTEEVFAGWVNGDYWYEIPRTGQIDEDGCGKCVALPGTDRVFEDNRISYSGISNGSGESKFKGAEYWEYMLAIHQNSDLAYPQGDAPDIFIDVTVDYFIGAKASVLQTGKKSAGYAFSESSFELLGPGYTPIAEVDALASTNGRRSQKDEIFGTFRATIDNGGGNSYFYSMRDQQGAANIAPVPVPASLAFIGTGTALLLGFGRRRRQAGGNAS